jgi:dipeptidyl aminopeptidase/acylaminoacyl peptidase
VERQRLLGAPAFSPDGTRLAFTARGRAGPPQIWILPLAEGGEAWQLTTWTTGAGSAVWSPDGARIAFTSSLTPRGSSRAVIRRRAAVVPAAAGRGRDPQHPPRTARRRCARSAPSWRQRRAHDPRVVTRLDYLGETSIQDERWSQIHVIEVRPGAEPRAADTGSSQRQPGLVAGRPVADLLRRAAARRPPPGLRARVRRLPDRRGRRRAAPAGRSRATPRRTRATRATAATSSTRADPSTRRTRRRSTTS